MFGGIRPGFRGRELGLLLLVAIALIVGSVSLGSNRPSSGRATRVIAPADPTLLAIYLGALLARTSRRCSPAAARTRSCCRPSA